MEPQSLRPNSNLYVHNARTIEPIGQILQDDKLAINVVKSFLKEPVQSVENDLCQVVHLGQNGASGAGIAA
jgi:hypothetical protein